MRLAFGHLLLATFCLWANVAVAAETDVDVLKLRTFTDIEGRSIEAEIISLADDTVTVRRPGDSREFPLLIMRLSDADRAFLETARPAITRLTQPLPETAFTQAARKDFRFLAPTATSLIPVSEKAWAQARYFVLIYGTHGETLKGDVDQARYYTFRFDEITPRRTFAVLWFGPAGFGNRFPPQPPPPEGDLRLAKELPRDVAVISTAAATRYFNLVNAELLAICEENSPGAPRKFAYTNGSDEDKAKWRERLMKQVPIYWPGCAYHWYFDRPQKYWPGSMFVVDREGKPVNFRGAPIDADQRKTVALFKEMIAEGL